LGEESFAKLSRGTALKRMALPLEKQSVAVQWKCGAWISAGNVLQRHGDATPDAELRRHSTE
jgi:hypothetical protein